MPTNQDLKKPPGAAHRTQVPALLASATAIALLIPGSLSASGNETELDATQVSAGAEHSLAVGADGDVYAWGSNTSSQLGTGDQTDWSEPVVSALPSGEKAVQVAAGSDYSLAVTEGGNLYSWGANDNGQLGQGTTTEVSEPQKVTFPSGVEVERATAGPSHALAVTSTGTVFAWGAGKNGEIGNEETENQPKPVEITFPDNASPIADISAGDGFSLAVDEKGTTYSWGLNKSGQLGNSKTKNISAPAETSLPKDTTIDQIAAGKDHVLAVTGDGELFGWGSNSVGQLCVTDEKTQLTPTKIAMSATTAQVSAGDSFSVIMTTDKKAYGCGSNSEGQLGTMSPTSVDSPTLIPLTSAGSVEIIGNVDGTLTQVSAGPSRTLLLTTADESTGTVSTTGATGTKAGSATADSGKTSPSTTSGAQVKKPAITEIPPPTVAPTLKGQVRIEGTGTWNDPLKGVASGWGSGVRFNYAWTAPDGTVLSHNPSYTPTDTSLIGSTITLTVKASKSGFRMGTATASITVKPRGTLAAGTVAIIGTGEMGTAFLSTTDTWPTAPGAVSLSYQWKADGANISGATTNTYAPVAGDVGKDITLSVVAKTDEPGWSNSPAAVSNAVQATGTLATGTVSITGTGAVGTPLTVTGNGWPTVPADVELKYQWKSGATPINGETGTTYTPVPGDFGNPISVDVYATTNAKGWSQSTTASSNRITISATLAPGRVSISGTGTIGSPLTAATEDWPNGPGQVTLHYQWKSGVDKVGTDSATYNLVAGDVGSDVTVTVHASTNAAGWHNSMDATSDPVTVTGALQAGTVSISGTGAVGSALTATPDGWPVTPTINLHHQWKLDGEVISGENGTSYTPVADDIGHAITVDVYATTNAHGWSHSTTASSNAVSVKGTLSAGTVSIEGTPRIGSQLEATTEGAWATGPGHIGYGFQWKSGGAPIDAADTIYYTPSATDVGKAITVEVYVFTDDTDWNQSATVESDAVTVTGTLGTGRVSVRGTPSVSSTLTANVSGWPTIPSTVELKYQWWAGNSAIASATNNTYVVDAGDQGKSISVCVIATVPGGSWSDSPQVCSAAVGPVPLLAPAPALAPAPMADEPAAVPVVDETAEQEPVIEDTSEEQVEQPVEVEKVSSPEPTQDKAPEQVQPAKESVDAEDAANSIAPSDAE